MLVLALLAGTSSPAALASSLRTPGPLSPRIANYTMTVELDPKTHRITGHEHLEWHNVQKEAAPSLAFHLYMNAFKNEESVFMRERAAGEGRQEQHRKDQKWGSVDVKKLVVGGIDLRPKATIARCGEDEPEKPDCPKDETVMTVPLNQPVAAGAQLDVDIDFETQLPEVIARGGYHGTFHLAGQWFPKVGVWEAGGKWNCHQYHATSEFFSDFGEYVVEITVPADEKVGASGVLAEERGVAGGKKTYVYHAEDVHDFAWTADTQFLVARDRWEDVDMMLYYHPGSSSGIPREFGAVKAALDVLGKAAFPYPYRTITIVEPPPGGLDAGGMEYPTLITTAPGGLIPNGLHELEAVAAHEFGHQYWYGMMATNEFEEAWMDEGVNEYMTGHALRALFPESQTIMDFHGLEMSYDYATHARYSSIADWDPLETYSWRFSRGHYFVVYPKTAAALRTLEGYLGYEKMMSCLRAYTAKWKFKHPHAQDFFDSFSQAAGQDLMWFFKPAFLETRVLDYEISDLRSEEKSPPLGLFDKDGQRTEVKHKDESKHGFESEVLVHRKGDFVFPVEIEVHFDDGSTERVTWNGVDRWKRFTFEKNTRAAWASVDPDGKVLLDTNWLNNGMRREAAAAPSQRMRMGLMFWLQTLTQGVGL